MRDKYVIIQTNNECKYVLRPDVPNFVPTHPLHPSLISAISTHPSYQHNLQLLLNILYEDFNIPLFMSNFVNPVHVNLTYPVTEYPLSLGSDAYFHSFISSFLILFNSSYSVSFLIELPKNWQSNFKMWLILIKHIKLTFQLNFIEHTFHTSVVSLMIYDRMTQLFVDKPILLHMLTILKIFHKI